jgi:hypothetical protein
VTLLYDSDQPSSIPSGVWAAGYVDGYAAGPLYWGAPGAWSHFPNAKRIAVFGQTNDGDCLDVERGDATPSEAPQWVKWRLAAGIQRPWVYVNRSNRSQVENALTMAGILTDQVALWVATLDGTQTVPAGPYVVAAVQYANSLSSGGHYDLSLVNEQFSPGGGTIGGDEMKMYIVNTPTEGQWLLCLPSGYYVHLTTGAAVAQLQADGATILAVDEQQHQNFLAGSHPGGSTTVTLPKSATTEFVY